MFTSANIARLLACAVVAASFAPAAIARAADEAINEDARKHFAAGVALLQDPDGARYEDAYREFEAAYAASLSPKILGNIGYCALKLERDGEAISAYTRYLQEVPDIDAAESAQIARDVATLGAGLVRVSLSVDASDATIVERRLPVRGESVTNLYGPVNGSIEIGIRPGHHVVEAKAHGDELEPWEFEAKPGAALTHVFARKAAVVVETSHPPVPSNSSHALPWVVMGVGAAALATGGVLGVVTLGKANAIASNCPGNVCPSTYALKPAQDDVHKFVTITDTLLIGGGVVAAAGLYLYFATGGSSSPASPSVGTRASLERQQRPQTQPVVGCSATGCVASLQGTF
jgi:hypothetical protein